MGLPSVLHRKHCTSNKGTFPPPLAFPGPCLYIIFLIHQQINSQVSSNKKFKFSHLKKSVSTDFLCVHAGPLATPHAGFEHTLTHAGLLRTPNPSDPRPSGYWHYHHSFFPNGKPGKMIEPVCVAKRLASTGSEREKIELCLFFFSRL